MWPVTRLAFNLDPVNEPDRNVQLGSVSSLKPVDDATTFLIGTQFQSKLQHKNLKRYYFLSIC
jgi:hypothetical protein